MIGGILSLIGYVLFFGAMFGGLIIYNLAQWRKEKMETGPALTPIEKEWLEQIKEYEEECKKYNSQGYLRKQELFHRNPENIRDYWYYWCRENGEFVLNEFCKEELFIPKYMYGEKIEDDITFWFSRNPLGICVSDVYVSEDGIHGKIIKRAP